MKDIKTYEIHYIICKSGPWSIKWTDIQTDRYLATQCGLCYAQHCVVKTEASIFHL